MAKILGISGSPRKSATYHSLKIALQAAQQRDGIETEIIALNGKNIDPCNHCDLCKKKKILCHIEDYMLELYPKLKEADGFIFASPVYAMNITPQLHSFFSRMRPLHEIKGGVLRNKLSCGIAVGGTRNGGQEMTINAITHACLTRGMIIVGNEPGNYSGAMVWSKDKGSTGVEEDEVGLASIKNLGYRFAEIVLIMEAGIISPSK